METEAHQYAPNEHFRPVGQAVFPQTNFRILLRVLDATLRFGASKPGTLKYVSSR